MKSSQKADIWMPLYIGDYLADTTRLTTEQHGAYLLLIMDYWRSGKLPDNDAVLSQITRLSPDAWSNARAMLKHFFSIENGQWVHKRIDEELNKAVINKEAARDKASKAAQARWNKANSSPSSNATSIPQAVPEYMLEECPSPSPSPSPLSATTTAPPKKHNAKKILAEFGITGDLAEDFIIHRKAHGGPITKTVMQGFQNQADKAGISIIDAVTTAIERNWRSFKADWINKQPQAPQPKPDKLDSTISAAQRFLEKIDNVG